MPASRSVLGRRSVAQGRVPVSVVITQRRTHGELASSFGRPGPANPRQSRRRRPCALRVPGPNSLSQWGRFTLTQPSVRKAETAAIASPFTWLPVARRRHYGRHTDGAADSMDRSRPPPRGFLPRQPPNTAGYRYRPSVLECTPIVTAPYGNSHLVNTHRYQSLLRVTLAHSMFHLISV
jgi:hypothetical protein